MEQELTDVTIAGAGPVGLMLAAELALGGARVRVLERERVRAHRLLGARALNAPSVTAFARRGLLAEVKRRASWWFTPPSPEQAALTASAAPVFVGHFAGIPLRAEHIDRDDPEVSAHTLGGGVIDIEDLVALLAERATELGVDIQRGCELLGFSDEGASVAIATSTGALRSRWLVGCDGGRSRVRKLAGFAFPGHAAEFVGRQAVVELAQPERLPIGDWVRTARGAYIHNPQGRLHIVEYGAVGPHAAVVTREEIEHSLQRVTGLPLTVSQLHAAQRYTDAAHQVDTYRKGRVLLAGDAAHIHSPAGGQGLNQGLGDALNLGWKLAATVCGAAAADLLDSYSAERLPIAHWVQAWALAQSALGRPDAASDALRGVVAELLAAPPATTHVLKRITGIWQRYDLGQGHSLTGASAPALTLSDGSCTDDYLRDGRSVLFDFEDAVALRAELAPWTSHAGLRIVTCSLLRPTVSALLVRPDGYVAWASSRSEAQTVTCSSALAKYLLPGAYMTPGLGAAVLDGPG